MYGCDGVFCLLFKEKSLQVSKIRYPILRLCLTNARNCGPYKFVCKSREHACTHWLQALFFVKNSHVRLLRSLIFRGGTVCHNGQSASLLSAFGLGHFSTLPAPSASAPCILAILTHLRVRVKICILTHPHENPPEGRASGGGVWFCRKDRNQQNSGKRMGTCCSSVLPSIL